MLFSSAKCSIVLISSPSLSSLSPLSLLSYLSLSSCQLADGVAITDGVVLGGVHDHGALVGRIGRGMRHVLVARMYVQQALIYSRLYIWDATGGGPARGIPYIDPAPSQREKRYIDPICT